MSAPTALTPTPTPAEPTPTGPTPSAPLSEPLSPASFPLEEMSQEDMNEALGGLSLAQVTQSPDPILPDSDDSDVSSTAEPTPPESGPSKTTLPAAPAAPAVAPATPAPPLFRGKTPRMGRRHRTNKKEAKVSTAAIRRLARRGGVTRMRGDVPEDIREALKDFLKDVLSKTVTYTDAARRKTVMTMDVVHALKSMGRTLYPTQV